MTTRVSPRERALRAARRFDRVLYLLSEPRGYVLRDEVTIRDRPASATLVGIAHPTGEYVRIPVLTPIEEVVR